MGKKPMSLFTPTVRLSFPNLVTPRSQDGKPPKYSASLIIDMPNLSPTEKQKIGALGAACRDKLREKFGDGAFQPDGKPLPNYKWPFRMCEEKADLEGYEPGMKFFNATSHRRPGMGVAVNANGVVSIQDTLDGEQFYPGCYVQASVNPFAFDSNGNKGVAIGLEHIVFIRDGDRLDGSTGSAAEAMAGAQIDASELGFSEANAEVAPAQQSAADLV